MASPTTYGLAALLLASVALNARLLTARAAPPAPPARPCPSAALAPSSPPRTEPTACERRLEACEQKAWDVVRQAIASDRKPPDARQPGARDASPATQAEVLCEHGKKTLRETWRGERDKTADNLLKNLEDVAEQEKNVTNEAQKMRNVVGLDDRQAAEVARAYREKRLARVAEARVALGREPRDFEGLLAALRALFADEDAILERVAGASAREAWRAEQYDGRTILMALFAAMADRDWEESIRW